MWDINIRLFRLYENRRDCKNHLVIPLIRINIFDSLILKQNSGGGSVVI